MLLIKYNNKFAEIKKFKFKNNEVKEFSKGKNIHVGSMVKIYELVLGFI